MLEALKSIQQNNNEIETKMRKSIHMSREMKKTNTATMIIEEEI